MDLFYLIVQYLYDYIFNPMASAFEDFYLGDNNPLSGIFFIHDGKLEYASSVSVDGSSWNYLPVYSDDGTLLYKVNGFTLVDILAFTTTVVIFILLFIVAVKFIVWLFKQISFITRF